MGATEQVLRNSGPSSMLGTPQTGGQTEIEQSNVPKTLSRLNPEAFLSLQSKAIGECRTLTTYYATVARTGQNDY